MSRETGHTTSSRRRTELCLKSTSVYFHIAVIVSVGQQSQGKGKVFWIKLKQQMDAGELKDRSDFMN